MEPRTAKELFTARELEFVRLMVEEGLSTSKIAEVLGITTQTAKNYRFRIYRKAERFLGYKDVMKQHELALFAVTHELVNMRTVIDRYSPVRLESPTSATRMADGGPGPGTRSLRATAS
jgi:predicted transcriptional regulator